MSVKTHYTAAATWTPAAWVTRARAVVAGGCPSSSGAAGGLGAILRGTLAVSGPMAVAFIAGGASGGGSASAGGAGAAFGGMIAGGGGGVSASYYSTGGVTLDGSGGDAGVPGAAAGDGRHVSGDPGGGKGGAADGTGGTSGSISGATSGNPGQSHSAGGSGGAGRGASGAYSGGGGGGFGGGGSGAVGKNYPGSGYAAFGSGGASSTYGPDATDTAFVGYNSGAPYVDIYVAGAPKVATLLGPTGNAWADRTKPIVLSFQHNSDTPGDALDVQTDAEVRYRKYNVGAEWTTVDELGTDTATSIAANTLDAAQYEWQVRTKADGGVGDGQGIWGPWSTSEYFQAATPPNAPTIISPESSATIQIATVTAEWTAPGQVEYQARLVGDNAGVADESVIYSDTGTKSGVATTATLAAMTNHVSAHVQVRIRTTVGGLWSAWVDVPVSIEWAGPPKPRVTLAVAGIFGHQIFVTVTNPPPVGVEPVADRIEVYVIEGETRERRAILAPGDGWIYETPPSGVEVGVEAVAIYTPTNVQTSSGVIW